MLRKFEKLKALKCLCVLLVASSGFAAPPGTPEAKPNTPTSSAPRRLTADELHAVLVRDHPTLSGAGHFVEHVARDPELAAYYNALIKSDPKLQAVVAQRTAIWNDYATQSARYLPPDNYNADWIAAPVQRLKRSLVDWQSVNQLIALRDMKETEALNDARAETIRAYSLPPDTDPERLRYIRADVYDYFIAYYKRRLRDQKLDKAKHDNSELESWRKFATTKLQEARAQNLDILLQLATEHAPRSILLSKVQIPSFLSRDYFRDFLKRTSYAIPTKTLLEAKPSFSLQTDDSAYAGKVSLGLGDQRHQGRVETENPLVTVEHRTGKGFLDALGSFSTKEPATFSSPDTWRIDQNQLTLHSALHGKVNGLETLRSNEAIAKSGWTITLEDGTTVRIPAVLLANYLIKSGWSQLPQERRAALNRLVMDVLEREAAFEAAERGLQSTAGMKEPQLILARLEQLRAKLPHGFAANAVLEGEKLSERVAHQQKQKQLDSPLEAIREGGTLLHPEYWSRRDKFALARAPWSNPDQGEGLLGNLRRTAQSRVNRARKGLQVIGMGLAVAFGLTGLFTGINELGRGDAVTVHEGGGLSYPHEIGGKPVIKNGNEDLTHGIRPEGENKEQVHYKIIWVRDENVKVPTRFFKMQESQSKRAVEVPPVSTENATFTLKTEAPNLRDSNYRFPILTPENHVITNIHATGQTSSLQVQLRRDPVTGFYEAEIQPRDNLYAKNLNNPVDFQVFYAPDPKPKQAAKEILDLPVSSASLIDYAERLESIGEKRLSGAMRKVVADSPREKPLTLQGLAALIHLNTNYTHSAVPDDKKPRSWGGADVDQFEQYLVDGELYLQCTGAEALLESFWIKSGDEALTNKHFMQKQSLYQIDKKARVLTAHDLHRVAGVISRDVHEKQKFVWANERPVPVDGKFALVDPTPGEAKDRPDAPKKSVAEPLPSNPHDLLVPFVLIPPVWWLGRRRARTQEEKEKARFEKPTKTLLPETERKAGQREFSDPVVEDYWKRERERLAKQIVDGVRAARKPFVESAEIEKHGPKLLRRGGNPMSNLLTLMHQLEAAFTGEIDYEEFVRNVNQLYPGILERNLETLADLRELVGKAVIEERKHLEGFAKLVHENGARLTPEMKRSAILAQDAVVDQLKKLMQSLDRVVPDRPVADPAVTCLLALKRMMPKL